jgi:maltooligosyltrehalose trehalohydrolase
MTTLLLLGPSVPLLFQGQEAAVPQPFVYFAGHDAPLADIVRRGRLEFLSQFPSLAGRDARETLPDPADETVFRSCRLDWRETPDGHQALRLYTDLLALRRSEPVLSALGSADVTVEASAPTPDVVVLRYERGADAGLCLVNLGRVARLAMNDPLLAPPAGGDWEPVFCSERSDYGGRGAAAAFGAGRWRLQAHCAWFLRSIARPAATT